MTEQQERDDGETVREPGGIEDRWLPGIWVGHHEGYLDEDIEIQAFDEDETRGQVFVPQDHVAEVVVALAERMPDEDLDYVIGQLEELEE